MPDGRPARRAHPALVTAVERVRPRVVGVTFSGPALTELPDPTPGGHLRISFAEHEPEGNDARYLRRTFTPRRYDREAAELYVEMVLHGAGLAADWARSAEVGDPVVITGAGGHYHPEAVGGRFVIAVDDTGVPAAGTVVEHLPDHVDLTVLCEVTDADDERPLSPSRAVSVTWLRRAGAAEPGVLLEAAVRELPDDLQAGWFVASEARTVRRIDRHLRDERDVPGEQIEARGYWRRADGESG